ncbi:coil containing protein [Vibrio phage 1.166.O._10N.261.51.C7]|nr:coil containing protein [Vibrio phage 1.166.O._10N.261.51.C7]AUR94035.1 coil containing protein [Vibrio phage 1.190.O._10N.286.51.F12]
MIKNRLVETIAAAATLDTEYVSNTDKAEVLFVQIDSVQVSVQEDNKIAFNAQCQLITKAADLGTDLIGTATMVLREVQNNLEDNETEKVKATSKSERVVKTQSGIETALTFEYYLEIEFNRKSELLKSINWE